jgi:hypothetical protein
MSSWKQIQEPILFLYVTTKKKKTWAEIYDFSRGLHGDRRAKFDSVIIRLNTYIPCMTLSHDALGLGVCATTLFPSKQCSFELGFAYQNSYLGTK